MKMLFVCIITLASCINACAMNTMNARKYINENRNNPEALRNLLIEMGRWPVPDLSAAECILKMKIKDASANASDNSIVNGGAAALTTAAANGQTDLQQKLWRGKVVAMIQEQGSLLEVRQLNDEEFDKQLRLKILEEGDEVRTAQTRPELLEALADLMELIDSLCELHNISRDELQKAQVKKRNEKGGFSERLFVEKASHKIDSKSVGYCLKQPHKYPEIVED